MTFRSPMRGRVLAASIPILVLCLGLTFGPPKAESRGTTPSYTDCSLVSVSQPFAAWGDFQDYFSVENGSFENGSIGWTLKSTAGSAQVVASGGDGALQLGSGGQALSSEICFDESRPHARFFIRTDSPQRLRGELAVEVVYTKPDGKVASIAAGKLTQTAVSSQWAPSPQVGIALSDEKIAPNAAGERMFRFRFKASGDINWQIDDVYVDPRRRQ